MLCYDFDYFNFYFFFIIITYGLQDIQRSASAPRGGRQPRSRKASLLSSQFRPILGIDDKLQSSLSWNLPSPCGTLNIMK